MPNCIAFTNKHTRDPATFAEIDDAMCQAIGVEASPDMFYASWYDILEFALDCGKSLDWLLGYYWLCPKYGPIVNFLYLNYTCEAWYAPR